MQFFGEKITTSHKAEELLFNVAEDEKGRNIYLQMLPRLWLRWEREPAEFCPPHHESRHFLKASKPRRIKLKIQIRQCYRS